MNIERIAIGALAGALALAGVVAVAVDDPRPETPEPIVFTGVEEDPEADQANGTLTLRSDRGVGEPPAGREADTADQGPTEEAPPVDSDPTPKGEAQGDDQQERATTHPAGEPDDGEDGGDGHDGAGEDGEDGG